MGRGEEVISLLEAGPDTDFDYVSEKSLLHTLKREPSMGDWLGLLLGYLRLAPRSLKRFAVLLIPSFLHTRFFPDVNVETNPIKHHRTAFLDGLRGIASLLVFFFHFTTLIWESTLRGYGAGNDPSANRSIMQLPILRLVNSGSAMVSLFFIVSGYTLSVAPVKYMRSTDPDHRNGLMRSLSSAVLRRPVRLFLPLFISTIGTFIMLRSGLYDTTRPIIESRMFTNFFEATDRLGSFTEELKDLLWNNWYVFDMMSDSPEENFQPNTRYNMVAWTIPVEWRASLLLYLTHLAFSQLRNNVRMALTISFSAIAVWANRWEMMLFWTAFFLADLDAAILAHEADGHLQSPRRKRWLNIFYYLNMISGLYLASYPFFDGDSTPGYVWLSSVIPAPYTRRHRFWEGIGCLQFVFAVTRLPVLDAFFTSPFLMYLGKISFALYLVHWPMLQTFGVLILSACFGITGRETALSLHLGFFLAAIFICSLVFWAADVFWRLIDIPCVKFAKWLESKLIR